MRKLTLVVIALILPQGSSPAVGRSANDKSPTGSVLAAYARYAQIVQRHDTQGLKAITTPDFTIRGERPQIRGQRAVAEMSQYMNLVKDGAFTAMVRRLSIEADTAVAMT